MYEDEDLQEIYEDIIELNEDISTLRRDLDNISASVEGTGENVTLSQTVEARFKKPPLPMGNSEQDSTTGANIFNLKKFLTDRNVPYTENTDGSLTFAVSGDYQSLNSQPLQFSDTDIAVSLQGLITLGTSVNVRIELLDSNNNWAGQITSSASKTENRTASKIRFNWGDVGTVTIKNVMLNIGSTAQPYEPYTNGASPNPDYPQEITNVTGDVEVVVENKNLLSNNKEDWEQGSVNPLNGELTTSTTRIRNKNKKQIKANTNYVIKVNNNNYKLINFEIYDKINNFITSGTNLFNISNFDNMTEIAFTSPTDAYYIIYVIRNLENTTITNTEIENINVQFEEGTIASDYVEHKEQTFTFPLGNEKLMLGDYLADDGIHHKMGEVVFDGVTEGRKVTAIQDYLGLHFCMVTELQRVGINGYNNLKCTHFIGREYTSNCIYVTNTGKTIVFVMPNQSINTPAKANDWLAEQYANSTPLIVQYELAEEVITPYTSAQQEVYNQIKQALSYEEQTNISSNTIALFNVKAFKNMNTSIESLQSRIELLKGRS